MFLGNSLEMELPYRKTRLDDERDSELEETNDVRSSLQGSLREGGRREDVSFLGESGPSKASSSESTSYIMFLVSVYLIC